jgi:hypothetical protein
MKKIELSNEEQTDYQALLSKLARWRKHGEQVLPAGTQRIGHTPERAPQAYTHTLFPAITKLGLEEMQNEIDNEVPDGLAKFYNIHNGCLLFDHYICVYGMRYSYDRADVVSILEQPFSLKTFLLDKNDYIKNISEFPFGSVGYHDHSDYQIATVRHDGSVRMWLNSTISKEYKNIFSFLLKQFSLKDNSNLI